MKFRPFPLLLFIAIASAGVLAQSKISPNHVSLRTDAKAKRPVAINTEERTVSAAVEFKSSAGSAAMAALEQDAFQLINVERGLAGLPALKWSEKVAKVARLHSRNMADFNFFSHKGVDGLMVDDRADQLNTGKWQAIGENIAFMKGYPNPAAVAVEKWLLSASHRSNMLSPQWSESAVGVAMTEEGKVYFTQVFLLK